MAAGLAVLPATGPLVGASFDRALTIVVQRWKMFAIVAVVAILLGAFNVVAGGVVALCFAIYWYYASLANAVRLIDPGYAMTAGQVLRLIGLNFVYGIAVELATIFLIIPGIYVANKWSLCSLIAIKEDATVSESLNRSWNLTGPFFWPTLGFNILSGLGVVAVAYIGYFLMFLVFGSIFGWMNNGPAPVGVGGPAGMGATVGILIYAYAVAYTYQAKDIAMLNWYNGLKHAFGES